MRTTLSHSRSPRCLVRICGWALLLAAAGHAQPGKILAQETTETPPAQSTGDSKVGAAEVYDRQLYLESFEVVWNTIKSTHWDPKLAGEFWDTVKVKYQPQIEQADSAESAIAVLEAMLGELGQSHFGIIPRQTYRAIERQSARGGPGWSGLTLRWIGDQFVVTRVQPGSPAEAAGVQVGWVVGQTRRLNSDQVLTANEIIEESRETAKHAVMRPETELSLHAAALVSGPIDQHIQLACLDLKNQPQTVDLTLVKGPGEPAKLGNLPTFYVDFDYQKLEGGLGLIRFNAFLDPSRLIRLYQQALQDPHNQNGLIIDLRGNLGGAVILAMGMSGWFVDQPHSLGLMEMKNTPLKLAINPRRPKFSGPVAILIDECSISCAELLSGGLQELGVARVFGSRSAGLVLPSTVIKLPTGDGFQYAMAGFESTGGREFEKNGVLPDEEIVLTRESLARDPDPVLTAARQWIEAQSRK